MATFEVPVVRIDRVENHPNADRLSLVYFRDYATISAKLEDGSPRYKVGDLVVYVPEGAVVPEYLLRQGFWDDKNNKGILAGKDGNRVKAIKLRGVLSQGIMFPVSSFEVWGDDVPGIQNQNVDFIRYVNEGDDVAEFLGITKYEPEIPASMSGDVVFIGLNVIPKFDVENIKKYPDILQEGEEVVITEKLHGTMMGFAWIPGIHKEVEGTFGDWVVFSKGLGSKGMVFKDTPENREKNIYVKKFLEIIKSNYEGGDRLVSDGFENRSCFWYGELYGKGVQDLAYGYDKHEFAMFDAVDSENAWYDWTRIEDNARFFKVETAPVLYRGPWKPELRSLADGKSTKADHIREGIVIKTVIPRYVPGFGRVILKDVSEAYLTRKGGTEFN